MTPKRPIGLRELASITRLPAEWLRVEAIGGRIPCLRVGRRLMFNIEAVNAALCDLAGRQPDGGRACAQA